MMLKALSKLKTTNVRPDRLCNTYCWVYQPQVIDSADLLLIPNTCEYFFTLSFRENDVFLKIYETIYFLH